MDQKEGDKGASLLNKKFIISDQFSEQGYV